MDLSQAESEYEDALARIPDIERAIGQPKRAERAPGRSPGPILRGQTIDDLRLPAVPAGVPSDLLERRPDILQAEQALVAANARIGVAKSLYFPTISLTGAFGTVSTESSSNLFTASSRTWNLGVPVTVPLFTAGRIGGEVKATEAAQQQAVQLYQQAILNAFREVEDALLGRGKSGQRLEALSRQSKALRNYSRLARLRYDEGYTSYLEVLDADRSLFNVELLLRPARTRSCGRRSPFTSRWAAAG